MTALPERALPPRAMLSELAIGRSGRVAKIVGADEVALRLLEMGLTPGAEVSIVGSAPLGDPLELGLRGYRLSVRRSEAARVELES
jgi:ferrous iron transport protein A